MKNNIGHLRYEQEQGEDGEEEEEDFVSEKLSTSSLGSYATQKKDIKVENMCQNKFNTQNKNIGEEYSQNKIMDNLIDPRKNLTSDQHPNHHFMKQQTYNDAKLTRKMASQLMSNEEKNFNQNLSYSFKKQSTLKSKLAGSSRYDEVGSEKEEVDKNDNEQQDSNKRNSVTKGVRPNLNSNLTSQVRISSKYTARVLDAIYEDRNEHKENMDSQLYKQKPKQIQVSNEDSPLDHSGNNTQQNEQPGQSSQFYQSRNKVGSGILNILQSPRNELDQNQNIQHKSNKRIQQSNHSIKNQKMAYRQKHKPDYDKVSNSVQKVDIDEHILYSNENINKVKQSIDFKKSIQQLSVRESKRMKKFDGSQGSGWMGSSNSNITIQSQRQNSKKRTYNKEQDNAGHAVKYEQQLHKKQQMAQYSEQSSEHFDESGSGSVVKYNNKQQEPKKWAQRNYTIRNIGNPEHELDDIIKNQQHKYKKQTTQHQQKKKVSIKKKYTNDVDNDSEHDGIITLDQDLSSHKETFSKKNINSSHRKQSSDNQRGYNKKSSVNHIGNIGEGLEQSTPKKHTGGSSSSSSVSEQMNKNCQEANGQEEQHEGSQQDNENKLSSNSEEDYAYQMNHSNKNENEQKIYIHEVVGQGILNEVYQQRGDEDSRRYRVFQHYLRTNASSKKYAKQYKNGENECFQWSSSTSNEDEGEQEVVNNSSGKSSYRSNIKSMLGSMTFLSSKASPYKKLNKQMYLQKKDQLIRRKNMRQNIMDQKVQLKSYRLKHYKSDNPNDKQEQELMLKEMQRLNSNFDYIEKGNHFEAVLHLEQKLSKKKKSIKTVTEPPMVIQGSDEDQFCDQTIQLLSQDQDNQKDILLFDPDSTGKAAWEVMGLFFIIYQSIIIPYRLCLDVPAENGWFYIEYAIDMCFIIDIFVQFNTGFYSKGNLIMQRGKIVQNYVRQWFFIDLIASFPYGWLTPQISNNQSLEMESGSLEDSSSSALSKTPQLLKMFKLARFLRFLRLLRVFKLKQILYRIEELIMNDAIVAFLNLCKVFFVVLFIGHWIACVFYSIGASEYKSVYHCWLTNANLQDEAKEVQYIASLYWAFATMTTVGYGDLYPITIPEKLFAMLSMLVACAVFAYVVGSIETIVRRSNTIENLFKEKILHVNQYLLYQNIPKPLRQQVRRYLEQMQEHKKREKLSQYEVLKMLNVNLRDEVLIHIVGKMLRQNRIFVRLFDDRLQSEMIFLLQQKMFLMDDHIFEEGDKQDKFVETIVFEEQDQTKELLEVDQQKLSNKNQELDIYKDQGQGLFFIIQGNIILMQRKTKTYITDLNVEAIFGEISFFSGRQRTLTAKSRGFSELMYLNQAKFLSQIHMKHPHAVKRYEEIRQKLSEKPDDYAPLFIRCYRCKEKGHIATQCLLFDDWKGNLLTKQINLSEDILQKDQKENQKLKDIYQKFMNPNATGNAQDDQFSDSSDNSIQTNTEIKSSDYDHDNDSNNGDGDPPGSKGDGPGSTHMYNDNSTRSKYSKSNATKQKHSRSDEKDSSWHGSSKNRSDINNRSLRGGQTFEEKKKKIKEDRTPNDPSGIGMLNNDPIRQSKQSRKTQNLEKVEEYNIEYERDSNEIENHASTGKQKYKGSNLLGPSVQFQTVSYGSNPSQKDYTPPNVNKQQHELNFTNATAWYNLQAQSHTRLSSKNKQFEHLDEPSEEQLLQNQKPLLKRFESDNIQKKQVDEEVKMYKQGEKMNPNKLKLNVQNQNKTDALYNSMSAQSKQALQVKEVDLSNPSGASDQQNQSKIQSKEEAKQVKSIKRELKKQDTLHVPNYGKEKKAHKNVESSKDKDRQHPARMEYKPRSKKMERRISIDIQPLEFPAEQHKRENNDKNQNVEIEKIDSRREKGNGANSLQRPAIRRTQEQNMYYNKRPPSSSRSRRRAPRDNSNHENDLK